MKKNMVKVLMIAACVAVPFFGTDLMAREHHRKQNTAAEIIHAVARLINPAPVVVRPAVPVIHIRRPAPPPPPRHPAPAHHPAKRGGHRR